MRIALKFADSKLSESEKQVFLRDFRLSLAKRPEKLLGKTRPMWFYAACDGVLGSLNLARLGT